MNLTQIPRHFIELCSILTPRLVAKKTVVRYNPPMKVNSSVVSSFVVGAVLASLPFLISRGPVSAQGTKPKHLTISEGREILEDDDYVYVLHKDKLYKVTKSTLSVWQSTKLE